MATFTIIIINKIINVIIIIMIMNIIIIIIIDMIIISIVVDMITIVMASLQQFVKMTKGVLRFISLPSV